MNYKSTVSQPASNQSVVIPFDETITNVSCTKYLLKETVNGH